MKLKITWNNGSTEKINFYIDDDQKKLFTESLKKDMSTTTIGVYDNATLRIINLASAREIEVLEP